MAKKVAKKTSKKVTKKPVRQDETSSSGAIETTISLLTDGILLGKRIAKDGINQDDLAKFPEVVTYVKSAVAFISTKPDIIEELKTLPKDYMRAIRLAQKVFESYKSISKAA